MKKMAFSFCMVLITISVYSQRVVVDISGKLTDKSGMALEGWTVENGMIIDSKVITDANGGFKIKAAENDILNFSKGGIVGESYIIDHEAFVNRTFTHSITISQLERTETFDRAAASALTNKSYWMGATLGYNLAGKTTEDVIGSAKVVLNPLNKKFLDAEWGIIGNFANFQGNLDKEELDKSIRKITQTTQGLFLGIGSIWTLYRKKENKEVLSEFRFSFSSGSRLNSFTNVGTDSTTEDLLQFKNSLGFEFEGGKWKNGGKLAIAIEGSLAFFDKSQYLKVFNKDKNSLFVLEGTIVLPIAQNIGILFNSTITPKEKPAFMLALLFKYNND